jgi:hypothetical protein
VLDYVELGLPHYPQIIKHPMDLGTMRDKIDRGEYSVASEFESDFRLVINNCKTFNHETAPVCELADRLQELFDERWSQRPATPPLLGDEGDADGGAIHCAADPHPSSRHGQQQQPGEFSLAHKWELATALGQLDNDRLAQAIDILRSTQPELLSVRVPCF